MKDIGDIGMAVDEQTMLWLVLTWELIFSWQNKTDKTILSFLSLVTWFNFYRFKVLTLRSAKSYFVIENVTFKVWCSRILGGRNRLRKCLNEISVLYLPCGFIKKFTITASVHRFRKLIGKSLLYNIQNFLSITRNKLSITFISLKL